MITLAYVPADLQTTHGRLVMVWSLSNQRGQVGERSSVSVLELIGGAS